MLRDVQPDHLHVYSEVCLTVLDGFYFQVSA